MAKTLRFVLALIAAVALAGRESRSLQGPPPPEIPLTPGLTFVLAVNAPNSAPAGSGIAVGDYEMVVAVSAVTANQIVLSTRIDAADEQKRQMTLDIQRQLPLADLEAGRLQILGFHTRDAPTLAGAQSLQA